MCDYEKYIESDVFNTLNAVDVSKKVEKKNGFSYLSWADSWGELKKRYPDATYTVYENKDGWNYHTDGRTAWTKVGVTVKGLEHIEYLPVMDFRNNSIPLDKITSFDVNKSVQRCLAKCIARHGLGLYVFSKEDLPEDATAQPSAPVPKPANKKVQSNLEKVDKTFICADCKGAITEHQGASAEAIANATKKKYGVMLCKACADKRRLGQEEKINSSPVEEACLQTIMNEPEDEGELPFDIC